MDGLRLINMNDVEAEKIDFLWHPYIAYRKITIVQGDPGEGKTTMMLAIAAALTRGDAISGGEKREPANVIFQSAEDGLADTIKPRLEQLGADCEKVDVIDEDIKALSIVDERIEAAIARTNAKLVILDPIQGYLGGREMNSANSIRPMMKKLAAVAEDTGAAIVLIGHLNKNTDSKSLYRGLGSIDIPAAARSVLTVGRLARVDENTRAFIQTKSNLAPTGKPQSFVLDPGSGFKWLGECEVTIKELLDGKAPDPNGGASQIALAQSFIRGMLANGDVPASDAFTKGEAAGFPSATMKRAKGGLGVKSVKRGNEWHWVSEEHQGNQVTEEAQEAHKIIEPSEADDSVDPLDTLAANNADETAEPLDSVYTLPAGSTENQENTAMQRSDSIDTVNSHSSDEILDPLDTLPEETLQIQDIQEAHPDDALDTLPNSLHKSKSTRRRERRRKARAAAAANSPRPANNHTPVPAGAASDN